MVLLRQDPPFDLAYIATTHLLERVQPKTLVVNDPANVRNAPEKVFVTLFADLMPPTLITRDLDEIKRFRAEQQFRDIEENRGTGESEMNITGSTLLIRGGG